MSQMRQWKEIFTPDEVVIGSRTAARARTTVPRSRATPPVPPTAAEFLAEIKQQTTRDWTQLFGITKADLTLQALDLLAASSNEKDQALLVDYLVEISKSGQLSRMKFKLKPDRPAAAVDGIV